MARRSLRPQLNQIRAWVQQGRTDAWIAHQLEISTSELREFRSQHGLTGEAEDPTAGADLRDEIEAEIEAAQELDEDDEEEEEEEEKEEREEADEESDGSEAEGRQPQARQGGNGGDGGDGEAKPRRRRRRGRRGRGRKASALEGTFDHGEKDGYGLWLDPAVKDNPTYAEHWAGRRAVNVTIEPERIVITRSEPKKAD